MWPCLSGGHPGSGQSSSCTRGHAVRSRARQSGSRLEGSQGPVSRTQQLAAPARPAMPLATPGSCLRGPKTPAAQGTGHRAPGQAKRWRLGLSLAGRPACSPHPPCRHVTYLFIAWPVFCGGGVAKSAPSRPEQSLQGGLSAARSLHERRDRGPIRMGAAGEGWVGVGHFSAEGGVECDPWVLSCCWGSSGEAGGQHPAPPPLVRPTAPRLPPRMGNSLKWM